MLNILNIKKIMFLLFNCTSFSFYIKPLACVIPLFPYACDAHVNQLPQTYETYFNISICNSKWWIFRKVFLWAKILSGDCRLFSRGYTSINILVPTIESGHRCAVYHAMLAR